MKVTPKTCFSWFVILSVLIPGLIGQTSGDDSGGNSLAGRLQIAEAPIPITAEGRTVGTATATQPTITLVFSPDSKTLTKIVVRFAEIKMSMTRMEGGVTINQTSTLQDASYIFQGPCPVTRQEFRLTAGNAECRGGFTSANEAKGTMHLSIVDYETYGVFTFDFGQCGWEARRLPAPVH